MSTKKRIEQHIHPSSLTEQQLQLMLKLTSIRSEQKIKALREFAVKGASVDQVCFMLSLDKSDFRKVRNTLSEVAGVVEQLIDIRFRVNKDDTHKAVNYPLK